MCKMDSKNTQKTNKTITEIAELELIKLPSTPSSSHHSQNQSQTNTSSNINNSSNSSSTTQQQSGGLFNSSTTTPNASSSLSVTNSAAARAASPEPTQITTTSSTKRELNLRNWFSSNTTSSRNDKRSETPANLMTVTVENNTQDIQSSFISPALSQLSEQTASSTPSMEIFFFCVFLCWSVLLHIKEEKLEICGSFHVLLNNIIVFISFSCCPLCL